MLLFFTGFPCASAAIEDQQSFNLCNRWLVEQYLAEQAMPENLYQTCEQAGVDIDKDQYGWLQEIKINQTLSADGLYQIEQFYTDFNTPLQELGLDFAGLDQLLEEILQLKPEKELSLWEKFLAWLKSKLSDSSQEDAEWIVNFINWLNNISIPDWLITVLYRGTMVLILLLALFVVTNEIRHAGLFSSKRKQKTAYKNLPEQQIHADKLLEWQTILILPVQEQVAALLRYVIQSLVNKGLLPDDPSLTNKELSNHLMSSNAMQGRLFATLYPPVEYSMYGKHCPNEEELRMLQTYAGKLTGDIEK